MQLYRSGIDSTIFVAYSLVAGWPGFVALAAPDVLASAGR
jgi:hypothetical protein